MGRAQRPPIAESSSPLRPSMNPSTDVCSAAFIFPILCLRLCSSCTRFGGEVARERFHRRLFRGHAGGHGWSGFAGAIKHPTNAKPVSKTAKITTPKHLLQGHFNLPALRERLE